MNRDTKIEREIAAKKRREMEERELNPLSGYSTTQLKAELRRRKQEYGKGSLI